MKDEIKEIIKQIENNMKQNVRIDYTDILELIAEIERSEKENNRHITQYIEAAKYNKDMFDENMKIGKENEQLQAVREVVEKVDWQKVWNIIHCFLLDEKTIEGKKSEIVKHLNQISDLQQALAAKGKDKDA